MKTTLCFSEVAKLIQVVFLSVNDFFFPKSQVINLLLSLLMFSDGKRKVNIIQADASLSGSSLVDQACLYWPLSAQTNISFFTTVPCQGVLGIQRDFLANGNSLSAWKKEDFHIIFFTCNVWIQYLWIIFYTWGL